MKVSIVLSAYNSEKFLERAVHSILDQSLQDFELILMDDGSTDKTRVHIERLATMDMRIIPVFSKENIGLTSNLNKGIKMAKADYIARMDADDIALPSRLQQQCDFLDRNPDIDILGSAAIDIDERGEQLQLRTSPELHNEIIRLLPKVNPMIHSTVMFRKKSLEQISYYNESYRTTQDYEMWFRAAGHGLKFHNLKDVLLYYRIDKNYHKRKSLTYRLYDCKLRLQGFRHIDLPYYKYYYSAIPLILGLLPGSIYDKIKKLDPRMIDFDRGAN